jgi:hypothetical protein
MNTIASRILRSQIKTVEFRCGIGIDFGKMLVVKAGASRRGAETEFYRSLVWLGRPANVASKLTDVAAKSNQWHVPGVSEGYYYPAIDDWSWSQVSLQDFVSALKPDYMGKIVHEKPYFRAFFTTSLGPFGVSRAPILMTDVVYKGLTKESPDLSSVQKKLWNRQVRVPEYDGEIMGGDVIFLAANDL